MLLMVVGGVERPQGFPRAVGNSKQIVGGGTDLRCGSAGRCPPAMCGVEQARSGKGRNDRYAEIGSILDASIGRGMS